MASPKRKLQFDSSTGSDTTLSPGTTFSSASPSPSPKKAKHDSSTAEKINGGFNIDSPANASDTKRPKRALKFTVALGETGSKKGRAKGEIRYTANGSLEHLLEHENKWVPAVFHNDIRAELIAEAALLGQYDHPRKRGVGDTDVTSYLPAHKTWGPAEADWPAVMFHVNMEKNSGLGINDADLWYHGGRLVLDDDNDPMRWFPDMLPATCSSAMESWELLALYHSDQRISISDIRGRMPKVIALRPGSERQLFTLNAISMKMTRFRRSVGNISPKANRPGSSQRNLSRSPTKSLFKSPTMEEAQRDRRLNHCQPNNKRGRYDTTDSEQSPEITGSPVKRARRRPLRNATTIPGDSAPKLKKFEPSIPAGYSWADPARTDFATSNNMCLPDFPLYPDQFPDITGWMGDSQMFSDTGAALPVEYNTKSTKTSLGPPMFDRSFQEEFQYDDFLYDDFSQQSASISPQPVLQQKLGFNKGDILRQDSLVKSNRAIPAVTTTAATEVAQGETCSENFADFMARFPAITGYDNNGQAIFADEQTLPLKRTGANTLFTQDISAAPTNLEQSVPFQVTKAVADPALEVLRNETDSRPVWDEAAFQKLEEYIARELGWVGNGSNTELQSTDVQSNNPQSAIHQYSI